MILEEKEKNPFIGYCKVNDNICLNKEHISFIEYTYNYNGNISWATLHMDSGDSIELDVNEYNKNFK